MKVLRKPFFWVAILVLANLVLAIFIFKPSFFKNVSNTNVKKDIAKSKPGGCRFLREEYCDKGHIEEVNVNGKKYKAIGFRLPIGTEITSPFDASVSGGTFVDSQWKGELVLIDDLRNTSESIMVIGDIQYIRGETWNRSAGEVIAVVKGEDIINIKDYNLIIIMTKKIGNAKFEDNSNKFSNYFPKL